MSLIMNVFKTCAVYLCFLIAAFVSQQDTLAMPPNAKVIADLVKHPQYSMVRISPTGDYLAVMIRHNEKRAVAILDRRQSNEVINLIAFNDDIEVASYRWVNDQRLVVDKARKVGELDRPRPTGQLFAVNADGTKSIEIYGFMSKEQQFAGATVVDLVDDRHILVQSQPYGSVKGKDYLNELLKLNVYTGKTKRIRRGSLRGSSIIPDQRHKPRMEIGISDSQDTVFSYINAKGDWQALETPFENGVVPLGFSQDNEEVYFLGSEKGAEKRIAAIWEFSLKDGSYQVVYQHPRVAPSPVMDEDDLIGVWVEEYYPEYVDINPQHPSSQLRSILTNTFSGARVEITSHTENYEESVVAVTSDQKPVEYYIFDRKQKQLKKLLDSRPWLSDYAFQPTEAIEFLARDNLKITGYLTLPKKTTDQRPGLVVMPHGGPHARDYWGFDHWVQLLSLHGYAVLKVNFRGSTGFGKNFEEAGWGEWGRKTQYDIIDGVQWVLGQGLVDPDNLHIFGASFGGYSALQSAVLEPDLFKTATGYVGVYDLPLLFGKGDIPTARWGGAYLNKTLGDDPSEWLKQSPARQVNLIKASVFIVHGEDDDRAHFDHAKALAASLEAQGLTYKWLTKDGEGHGFYKEENRQELWNELLGFLTTQEPRIR